MGELIKHSNTVYVALDGDGIGRKVGRAVLADDSDELHAISARIDAAQSLISRWIKDVDGNKISGGGDECTMAIPEDSIERLESLRKDIEYAFGFTVSMGVGKSLSEAGRALLIAKLKGKNRIITFSKATEKEIIKIKKRAKKGAFKSMEEHKLAEAYLKKSEIEETDCQYCAQSDGVDSDHCKYCHDAEAKEGKENCQYCERIEETEEDCKYCKEKDQKGQEECNYCKDKDSTEALTSPDSNNEQAPAGSDEEKAQYDKMGMNPPAIGKPNPSEELPIGQNAPMDTASVDPELQDSREVNAATTPPIDPDDNHSRGALTAIAEQIEAEATPAASEADSIDDANINSGNEMEGNISRPEGFDQNTPQDMGVSGTNPPSDDKEEDETDLSDVLEEGLNHNADSIQREKTIQVVSQALAQFKGCRDALENIKGQAPQLYQASISMLRAMIEMASLLGLGQSEPELGQQLGQNSVLGQEQASITPQAEENEWHEPFPAHPDQGGEPKPGHAPSSKPKNNGQSTVGQPIGKLSGKHTTEHIARTPMPPGAVNAKGQQKVIDPKTGEARWIDRKQGMVQSATGVPIKPPPRGNDIPQAKPPKRGSDVPKN